MEGAGGPQRVIRAESPDALDGVTAGFSLRRGGVSAGPYRSLNLGLSTGDDPQNVARNRRLLFAPLGIDVNRLAVAGQVHGSDVLVVTEPGLYPGMDGLVTTAADVTLCITAADCAVVLMADPVARVAAACHSGWRGTAAGVAEKTLASMLECGARAESIRAYVSPCICVDHFEVGPEVADRFAAEFVERRPDWPRPHVDMKAAIAAQLVRRGLPEESVAVSSRCTFAETNDFFSYRAEGGTTGRMMGFIRLDP